MKVFIEIENCKCCPDFYDTLFGNFCASMPSVSVKHTNRQIDVTNIVPSWCPKRINKEIE